MFWIEIKYANHPEMIQAWREVFENPDDPQARQRLEDARDEMDGLPKRKVPRINLREE